MIFSFIGRIWKRIIEFLRPFLKIITGILAIGLPLFVYLAFFAKEPVMEPEIDVELGRSTALSIAADTTEYPLLNPDEFPEAYAFIRSMVDELVSGADIQYADLFKYDSIKIINRDDILNAFCTPGGYIYVYTGLIKYLDAEDHLAGVLAHEIAHAELRHSAMAIQREFGMDRIYEFTLLTAPVSIGDAINLKILNDLTKLKYTRNQEASADEFAVRYLIESHYACDGIAGFFIKMLSEGDDVRIPEFLSDHPASESRVREVTKLAEASGCDTALSNQSQWEKFKASLEMVENIDTAAQMESN